MYYWGGGWGGMLLAMLLNAIVWVSLIALLVWLGRRFLFSTTSGSEPGERGPSATDILRQRYARGEIDEATFERMRQQLSETDSQPASLER